MVANNFDDEAQDGASNQIKQATLDKLEKSLEAHGIPTGDGLIHTGGEHQGQIVPPPSSACTSFLDLAYELRLQIYEEEYQTLKIIKAYSLTIP